MSESERLNKFQQHQLLFSWVGQALTSWSNVESELANMFAWCNSPTYYTEDYGMKADNYQYSLAIFNTVSFDGKIKILKTALRHSLDQNEPTEEALFTEWNQLRKKRIPDVYKLRNKCAHWGVFIKSPNAYLAPTENVNDALANIGSETDPDRIVQTEQEVKAYTNTFSELYMTLFDLRKKLIALPGPKARWLALAQKYVNANT